MGALRTYQECGHYGDSLHYAPGTLCPLNTMPLDHYGLATLWPRNAMLHEHYAPRILCP